ncbi:MAG TPA: tRNA (adenosine(37)-N6)-threonylcarbamoyltransferase complex ATPase subunit type 1 TsaE [Dehalococcoidia bacterium]|nr:tRNA (adenosine(37)-N6)-threonylcarbamoyltransferase complex ATPase subunit type 1 TsaE [Dehalococcoidia bacterium]
MSGEVVVESRGPAQTRRLGERLARHLQAGDVLLLSGELGAGKTVLVQGLARGLGVKEGVSSKSFVLLGEYEGRLKLYHADLYRLEAPEEAEELALDELCRDGVLVVEWPERAWHVFPPDHLLVRIQVTGARTRRLLLSAAGERSRRLLSAIAEAAAGSARG